MLQKLKWYLLLCPLYQKHQTYTCIQWKDQLFECIWVCIGAGWAPCVFKEFIVVISWCSGSTKCWSIHLIVRAEQEIFWNKLCIIFLYTFPPFSSFEGLALILIEPYWPVRFYYSLFLNLCMVPISKYMFKVNNRNTTTRYKICSKLTIKTPELRQASFWCLYC